MTLESGALRVTIVSFTLQSYQDFYNSQSAEMRRTLDATPDSQNAFAIGIAHVRVENAGSVQATIEPDKGTFVIGTERIQPSTAISHGIGRNLDPGVIAEGLTYFFVKSPTIASATSLDFSMDRAATEDGTPAGPSITFELLLAPLGTITR